MGKSKLRLTDRYRLVDPHSMAELRQRYPEAKPRTRLAAWLAPILLMVMLAGTLSAIGCTLAGILSNTITLLVGTGVGLLVAVLTGVCFAFCIAAAGSLETTRQVETVKRMQHRAFPHTRNTILPPTGPMPQIEVETKGKSNHGRSA